MNASASPTLEALYRALDFDRPLDADVPADRALYVPKMHNNSGFNPVDELRENIEIAARPGTWLFTGHRGVGKSTELRRIAHELRQKGHFVVVADMGEFLNLAEPITTEILLLTLASALAEGADRLLGGERLDAPYSERLWNWLTKTEVKLEGADAQIGLGDSKLSLKAVLKQRPEFRQRVLQQVSGAVGQLHEQTQLFVRQITDEIAGHSQYGPDKKVVLILDSLERLRVAGINATTAYEGIQQTFDVNGEFLKFETLHVVYSVPPYLPFLCPKIGSYFGVEIATLPHVKVFQTPGKAGGVAPALADPAGVGLMVQTVQRRLAAVEQLLPRPVLDRLALASSGSLRDYFRLLRSVITKARVSEAVLPLTDMKPVDLAEQVLRNEMPLAEDDKAWLRVVRQTHGDGLDKRENLPRLAALFDSGLILNYRNGREWCEVHYLLHEDLAA